MQFCHNGISRSGYRDMHLNKGKINDLFYNKQCYSLVHLLPTSQFCHSNINFGIYILNHSELGSSLITLHGKHQGNSLQLFIAEFRTIFVFVQTNLSYSHVRMQFNCNLRSTKQVPISKPLQADKQIYIYMGVNQPNI